MGRRSKNNCKETGRYQPRVLHDQNPRLLLYPRGCLKLTDRRTDSDGMISSPIEYQFQLPGLYKIALVRADKPGPAGQRWQHRATPGSLSPRATRLITAWLRDLAIALGFLASSLFSFTSQ